MTETRAEESGPGIKHDAGKILPDLVLGDFMPALELAVFAGTFGAMKYAKKKLSQTAWRRRTLSRSCVPSLHGP